MLSEKGLVIITSECWKTQGSALLVVWFWAVAGRRNTAEVFCTV